MNPNLLSVVVGILLLFLGRKVFWFFVAVIGFLWGLQLASQLFSAESQILILAVAIAIGLLGALLAVFLQHLAVGFAGFLAGAHLFSAFSSLLQWQTGPFLFVFSLVGGVIGAILAVMLLDWALIVLSSLVGASLICQALPLQQALTLLCFVVLTVLGILIQSSFIRHPAPVS
jgi:Domain of unknown function (DUF4203)